MPVIVKQLGYGVRELLFNHSLLLRCRQLFEVVIQASIRGKITARET